MAEKNSGVGKEKSERSKQRKRVREPLFDSNRTIPHRQQKERRIQNQTVEMNANKDNVNTPMIVDLSQTINARTQSLGGRPNDGGAVVQPSSMYDGNITPEFREIVVDEAMLVQRSLEEKVKMMIQDEMSEMRKQMSDLANSMASLMGMYQSNPPGQNGTSVASGPINENRLISTQNQVDQFSNNSGPTGSSNNNSQDVRDRAPQPIGSNFDQNRIRIDKLGVEFTGLSTQTSVEDFIFRLEHLQRQYGLKWSEIIRDFHLLLTGSAREWYWLLVKTQGCMDWPNLRHALLSQFQSTRSNFEIMRDLVERKQQANESTDSFFHNMNQIRSRLVQPIPEYDMIKILKRNVRESLGRIVYPIPVSSVEQLRVECHEAERNFPRRDSRNIIPPPRQQRYVNEVYEEEQEQSVQEVAAVDKTIVCWNCQQEGHVFKECLSRQRNLFCYKCGRPDTITPKCPNCSNAQGNSRRSVGVMGLPRSSELAPRQLQN